MWQSCSMAHKEVLFEQGIFMEKAVQMLSVVLVNVSYPFTPKIYPLFPLAVLLVYTKISMSSIGK